MYPDNKIKSDLYSISSISKACNLSRSTIMRMETFGVITPAYKNDDNGYRYYDCENISQIINTLKYQHLGFTKHEIADLTGSLSEKIKHINALKEKYRTLLHELDILSMEFCRGKTIETIEASETMETSLPAGDYFESTAKIGYSLEGLRRFIPDSMRAFIKTGAAFDISRPAMLFFDRDSIIKNFDGNPCHATLRIPVLKAARDQNFIYLDACRILTAVFHLNYNQLESASTTLKKEAQLRELHTAGHVSILGFSDIFSICESSGRNTPLRLAVRVHAED